MLKFIILFSFLLPFYTSAQDENPKRLGIILESALGLNTNPSQENVAETNFQRSGKGQGQNTYLSKTDLEIQLAAKAHYKAIKTDTFTLHTNYDYFRESYLKKTEENYNSHDFFFPVNLYTKTYRFELTPSYSYLTLNNTPYQSKTGIEGRATTRFDSFDFTIFSSLTQVNALDTNYSFESGNVKKLGAEFSAPWEDNEFMLTSSVEQSDNNDELGKIASYNAFSITPSFSISSNKWEHHLEVSYTQKNYNGNASDNSQRLDHLIIAQYKPSYFLTKEISLFIDVRYSKNNSNISLEEYTQFITLLGFTWFAF